MRFFFLTLLFVIFNCSNGNTELINNQAAQSEIESAIDVKRKECGEKMNPPRSKSPYPKPRLLAIQPKSSLRNIRLCSAAILRSDCPFIDYPYICYFIYIPTDASNFSPLFDFNKFNKNNRFKPNFP